MPVQIDGFVQAIFAARQHLDPQTALHEPLPTTLLGAHSILDHAPEGRLRGLIIRLSLRAISGLSSLCQCEQCSKASKAAAGLAALPPDLS